MRSISPSALIHLLSLIPLPAPADSPLQGKMIVLDPGHGGTGAADPYRTGPSGEYEERINLRVGLALKELLTAKGAKVLMTREEDVQVPLSARAKLAVDNKADLFLSIHHNATADRAVNFPIVYYHGHASGNRAGVELGRLVIRRLREAMYAPDTPVSLCSDHAIFPKAGGAVIRESWGIPGVLSEASFFTNPGEEARLKDPAYNRKEAEAYARAIGDFFALPERPPLLDRYEGGKLPPFEVFQEADRMKEEAKRWRENHAEGVKLMAADAPDPLGKALDLLTLSAQSFPDSYVARDAHLRRAEILNKLARPEEAAIERRRAEEYFVPVP